MLPFCRSCRCHFHGSFRDELGLGSDIHRWGRKIGNVPITHLVTGRDGRSYPGIGSDSCSNDGGCRRFSRGPSVPCIRQCSPGCVGRHRLCRGFYFVVCSRSSLRTNRYQTGTGFFYHLSDRFHDGCARSLGYGRPSGTRLYGFDVPPFTHAMFKALLFLCAGAIIHTIGSNEMSRMGGLRKYMPFTHLTFLVACLAISGIPPFPDFSVKTRF